MIIAAVRESATKNRGLSLLSLFFPHSALVAKRIDILGFFMLASVWCGPVLAANCQSNASGNWSVAATWTSCGGGIPGSNDNVAIVSPHTVTLDVSSAQLRDMVVQAGATLIGNAGTVLTIGRTGGVNLTNNGTINFTAGATIAHVNNAAWTGNGTYNLYAIDLSNRTITFSGVVPTQINLNAPTPIVLGGISGLLTSNVATTWNFNGATAQTLPTGQVTYGAMTINNPAGVTLGTALTAVNILGNLSVQSGTLNNGGFAITLAANRNFSVANGATFRMTGTTGMVTVSGTGAKTFGTTLPTCSTVDYAGTAQTVSNETYGNLTLSGSGVKTMPNTAMNVACDFSMSGTASATALAALTVGRNLTLNPGTSFAADTFSHSVSGNFSNSGTFTANTSTFTFNGASTQDITGVTIFYNLTMNNAAGFTINDNVTAANVLTMTSGIVSTGANTLITTANCPASISRTSGHIAGNLRLTFPTTDPVTCTFHVGDANNYAPITVTKTGANAGTLTGSSTAGDHADTTAGTSGINKDKSVNRYWTLTGGTLASGTPYSAIFQFCSATGTGCGVNDVDAGANTANFIVAKKTSGSWTLPTVGSKTATTTQATGLSSFGDFAVGEATPSVDHYELSLPTSSITCLPSTATVTACADNSSPCTSALTTVSGETATLATSAGSLGSTTVTFNASGIASTTLSHPAAADGAPATVTLSGESTAAANPRQCCPDGVSCVVANSCSTTFNTTGFIFSASVGGGVATIPTQVAGTSSGAYYLRAVRTNTTTKACESALAGANTVNFAYECNNPPTCYTTDLMSVNGGSATTIARNDNGSVSSYTSVNMTFDADGNAPFTFNYSDVGQVTLHVSKTVSSAPLTGSSNAFVVRPFGFVLSNIQSTAGSFANPGAADASGTIFIKAGDDFTATVRATTSGGAATPNYGRETTPEGVLLIPNLVAGLGLTANPAITNGSIAGGEFGAGGAVADANGEATVTNLAWGEVGIITLTPSVADGDYLGAGDVTGTTTGNVGRFTPFDLNVAYNTPQFGTACGAGLFTYIGQKFNYATAPVITVTARNKAAATTQNYKGTSPAASAWFKITNADLTGKTYAAAVGALDPSLIGSPDPVISDNGNGTGTLTFGSGGGIVFTRSTPVAPFDADIALSINVIDSDGIAFSGNPAAFGAATPGNGIAFNPALGKAMRFGRLKLSNAYGSELINLPAPVEAQYYNGTVFVTNTEDSCTTLVPNNVKLTTALTGVTATLGGAFVGGKGSLTLSKPSPAAKGVVDICVDLDVGAGGDASCQATTPADKTYLQGKWSGANYDKDPVVRGTFGLYKSPNEIIFIRENY